VAVIGLAVIVQALTVFGKSQQANPEGHPTFEVVSVRPAGPLRAIPHTDGRMYHNTRPLRFTDRTVVGTDTLMNIIQIAYSAEDWEIDGPGWMDSLTYTISATMPPDTSREKACLMLRAMLVERFGLKFRREKREIPVYALIEAKGGFKLREARDPGPRYVSVVGGVFEATGSIDDIVGSFRTFTENNAPVLNMTGIRGIYGWKFDWNRDPNVDFQSQYSPEFWNALRRYAGLTIEKRKVPRDIMVIDSAEREPTPN